MPAPRFRLFVLKVASRCNLNCSYCYVYNKADQTWQSKPPLMSDEVFTAAIERIGDHCKQSGQDSILLALHGGEPTLAGPHRVDRWCRLAERALAGIATITWAMQTNATTLDARWVDVIRRHDIRIGVSLDGPAHVHDRFRLDRAGRGSHHRTERGTRVLSEAGIPFDVIAVVQLGVDGMEVHDYLAHTGCRRISYLLPDDTYDTVAAVRARYGPTPCADVLLPVLDHWWRNTTGPAVREFDNLVRLLAGGWSQVETVGNAPARYVFVEADGSIEALDVLKACDSSLSSTGLNVLSSGLSDLDRLSDFHRAWIVDGVALPSGCAGCVEAATCGGGYLPHRYSSATGFDQPSIWCRDLLALFAKARQLSGLSPSDTLALQRQWLAMATGSGSGHDLTWLYGRHVLASHRAATA